MSKAVLISIRPEWVEKILNGEKTIEVRKTRPKLETPFKCYIYCTKPKFEYEDCIGIDVGSEKGRIFFGGGKVVGEFVCNAILPVSFFSSDSSFFDNAPPLSVPGTCLTDKEIAEYLGNGKTGYGWLISDLKIYDDPMKLGDLHKDCAGCGFVNARFVNCDYMIKRAPQSWCYVMCPP